MGNVQNRFTPSIGLSEILSLNLQRGLLLGFGAWGLLPASFGDKKDCIILYIWGRLFKAG